MKEYPYPEFTTQINSKRVSTLPVSHTDEFFEQYKGRIQEFVDSNDVLVLERTIGAEFWNFEFFKDVSGLVHKQKKKVYVVDPITELLVDLDFIQGIGGVYLMCRSITGLPKQPSRRAFLKGGSKLIFGSYLFSGSIYGKMVQKMINHQSRVDYGYDDKLFFGPLTDFRNIIIAEGLERLCTENITNAKTIGSVHGAGHSGAVHAYLENPGLRKKKLLYKPLEEIADMKIREFTPDENGWKLTGTY